MLNDEMLSKISMESFPQMKELKFLKRNYFKLICYHIISILTCFVLYLIFYWNNYYYVLYGETNDYSEATKVLIITQNELKFLIDIEEDEFVLNPYDDSIITKNRFIRFTKSKYYLNLNTLIFNRIETKFARQMEEREYFDMNRSSSSLGIDWSNIMDLEKSYGQNKLDIEKSSILKLVFFGIIHPLSVSLFFLGTLCYMSYKMTQATSLFLYVILIIIFYILEVKTKENQIISMSSKDFIVKVFRKDKLSLCNSIIIYS